jgi:hypothetical protein
MERFCQKLSIIPAEAGHEVKLFSAIRKVKASNWKPAFVGMLFNAFPKWNLPIQVKDCHSEEAKPPSLTWIQPPAFAGVTKPR